MSRNAVLSFSALFLLASAWVAGSTNLGAQQAPGAAGAGSEPTARGSRISGVYSSDSSVPNREVAPAAASRPGSKALDRTGKAGDRSAWIAGANSTGPAGAIMWNAPETNSRRGSTSSWNAGARSFGLDRQQGGIWRELPGAGVQSGASVTSAESDDLFTPPALTPKGAALIKGSRISAPYASHSGTGFGVRGGGRAIAARRGSRSTKSQFGSQTGRFDSPGQESGSKPATSMTPTTGKVNGPTKDDMLPLNEEPGSQRTLGSDPLDSTAGTSH